jgi:phospholipid-binding lipoprotein MlaA
MVLDGKSRVTLRPVVMAGVLAGVLGGCAAPLAPTGINDPYEAENRKVHEANTALDRALVRPASQAYGGAIPAPVQAAVSNVARNLDLPGDVMNDVLQGRLHHALENTARFAFNSTLGLGGLFDPASLIGLNGKPTDFGQTLHMWGVREGNYVELPFVGPSTTRDTAGLIVDLVANPVGLLLHAPESIYATVAKVGSRLGDRSRYSETVDSILYESADSYAQARLLYLQNRRFELGQEAQQDDFFDPYEDPYGN